MVQVGVRTETKVTTRLKLTAEVRTGLELLQLPQIELEQRISEELEQNPLLEWDESTVAELRKLRNQERHREGIDFSERSDEEAWDPFERNILSSPGLHQHIEWQIGVAPWDEADKDLALELEPLRGDQGFLREHDSELAEQFGVSVERIAHVRNLLQTLEPTGLAARDLRECLLLQLRELGEESSVAARVIGECCTELESGDLDSICGKLDLPTEQLDEALSLLRRLDPSPGLRFRDDRTDPVIPELEIRQDDDGHWIVEPYLSWSRRIRRSDVMERFLEDPDSFSAEEQRFIREKLRTADYFLQSLKQRDMTLLRVAEAIIARQHVLLEQGPQAAGPLTLKDIGADVGLHESTISRVTRRKYAVTPRGIMELKAFFRQSVDGVHTPDAIQQRIAELIRGENPARPLSDQKISDILRREGIDVARRTVAKYRGELGIPGRSQRRKTG